MSRDWTPLDMPGFQPVIGSGCSFQVPQPQMPPWAREAAQFEAMWVYGLAPGESVPSRQTSAEQVGRLLTERRDPKDHAELNYNWYAVVRDKDGKLWQSGPHRDIDFGHQLNQRPTFLNDYPDSPEPAA